MTSNFSKSALFISAFLITSPAFAEETPQKAPDTAAIWSISVENDIISGQDNNYTNGVRIAYISPESDVPPWLEKTANALPFFQEEGNKRWGLAFGQNMYTPDDITVKTPQPDDQPYAGFLYGSATLISDTKDTLDTFQVTLGMVGPASLADETQSFIHSAMGSDEPQGWRYQLENEPGLIVTYEKKWREFGRISTGSKWGADITPSLGGSVGNIYTHATAGAIARFGYDLPSDYGPPLISPSLSGSDFFEPDENLGWYLFAGLEGRAVARNIFLDGNTFEDSPSVDKYPFVGGIQAGAVLTIHETRVAYTHVLRTRSFEGQDDLDNYGALTVSWRF